MQDVRAVGPAMAEMVEEGDDMAPTRWVGSDEMMRWRSLISSRAVSVYRGAGHHDLERDMAVESAPSMVTNVVDANN